MQKQKFFFHNPGTNFHISATPINKVDFSKFFKPRDYSFRDKSQEGLFIDPDLYLTRKVFDKVSGTVDGNIYVSRNIVGQYYTASHKIWHREIHENLPEEFRIPQLVMGLILAVGLVKEQNHKNNIEILTTKGVNIIFVTIDGKPFALRIYMHKKDFNDEHLREWRFDIWKMNDKPHPLRWESGDRFFFLNSVPVWRLSEKLP